MSAATWMRRANWGAVRAVWRRQLEGLLLNPLGYVFILVFVLASAAVLFWPQSFYARNIADLGLLPAYMPWLLVVLLPTLSMGAWASERELGTEEQLLTLPMRALDALLGKWLGVASYFTLALLCTLSNVIVLRWLGSPDPGMIAASYLGWWLIGLVFAALGVLASALVPLPAVAFVIGVMLCSAVAATLGQVEFLDPFQRGLVPLGRIIIALTPAALAIGAAVAVLEVRRWRRADHTTVLAIAVVIACGLLTLFNIGVQIDRHAADWDVTAERLSSLSPASRQVLTEGSDPVRIVAFVSSNLPAELQPKGKEVENALKALGRAMGGRLDLQIHRPADPLDEAGSLASQYYGLSPKKVAVDTVAGRQETEIFLGAAVSSGPRSQTIAYFDPGLGVEYELVRAVQAVGRAKRRVVGVAATDLSMMGGFDFRTRSSQPKWAIVREWEKQYDVREVNLEVPVADDVEVLVVPQPSRLSDPQLENLHDYIWAGRPALILEDPLPMFTNPQLGTSQPKTPPNPMMGMPPEDAGEKGDLGRLLGALGIDMPADRVVWSDFNPSHAFRGLLPPSMVWLYSSQGCIAAAPTTTGVNSLLLPFPGEIRPVANTGELKVATLITPTQQAPWGTSAYSEFFDFNPMFGPTPTEPRRYRPSSGATGALAVEISGFMKRAYPLPAPPTTQPATAPAEPQGLGLRSASPIHVIFVADTDLASDQFFELYRNADNRFGRDELRFLQDLKNVQLLSNAVDALAGDAGFLELRTRRAQRRPLERLEQVLATTQTELRQVEDAAQQEAEQKIQKLRDDVQKRLDEIRGRKDLDENARMQLVAQVERSANRSLDADVREVNRQADLKTRQAEIVQQRAFQRVLNRVRLQAMGWPAAVLAALAAGVFAVRLRGERLAIPESRRRR
jgi:ABC-2 type transport system permease protein